MAPTLAIMLNLILIGMVASLMVRPVPQENASTFSLVLGIISGGATSVWAYYFGSSAGSRNKDELVNKLADKAAS